jgi:hypothetical protein
MDLKRLAVVLFQRLAPIYIAVALSWVTGYFVFTLGGIGLAIALELAWPLLRPFFDVLYDELMAQHTQAQTQRRAALLKAFLPFFQAYKTVLTTYPYTMLTASAPEVAAQSETCHRAIRDVKHASCPLSLRERERWALHLIAEEVPWSYARRFLYAPPGKIGYRPGDRYNRLPLSAYSTGSDIWT